MKRLTAFTISLLVLCIIAFARKPPMIVQFYGESFNNFHGVAWYDAYLILPDGSHALATCTPVDRSCAIEAFAPEKRVKVPCDLLKSNTSGVTTCYQSERYEAKRKNNNDIILRTGNGEVTYHITGSW